MVTYSPKGAYIMRGRLSTKEKYTIQGMLQDNKSVKIIAETLERPVATIKKYVDGELKNIHKTVKRVRNKQVKDLEKELNAKNQEIANLQNQQMSVADMVTNVTQRLSDMGMPDGQSSKLVQRALVQNGNPPNKEVLFQWAMQSQVAKDKMVTQTAGKRENVVAMMTEAASQQGDAMRENMPKTISRTARNNLFAPLDGKMIGE